MPHSLGLRSQLLAGLLLIIFVATVSVGLITSWTTRTQIAALQVDNGQLLGTPSPSC